MRLILIATLIPLTACAAHSTPPAIETRVVTKTVEVSVPCPVKLPERPAKLERPLPTDSVALSAVLAERLLAWDGPGGFGDQATAAISLCQRAGSPSVATP